MVTSIIRMAAVEFRDPRSERIYRRLLQLGDGPAAFFADAYRMIEGQVQLDTTAHMVGHALREIESGVRSVLSAATNAPTGERADGTRVSTSEVIRHIGQSLGLEERGSVVKGWLSLAGSLHGVAHRRNLQAPRAADDRLNEIWLEMLAVLDDLLDRFETRYADVFARLDRLLAVPNPGVAEFDEFAKTIPSTPQVLDYFFLRLASPGWFPGLNKRGVFDQPPAPIEDIEQGTIAFPRWPAAPYLKSVAGKYPAEVARIVASLQSTNVRAQDQAVEVVLELPVKHALEVVPKIQEWIPRMLRFRFFGAPVVLLAEKFAAHGERAAAVDLVRQLLAPPEVPDGDDAAVTWRRNEEVPHPLERRAEGLFGALVACLGFGVVDLVGDPLEERLRARLTREDDGQLPYGPLGVRDHTKTWLPRVGSEAPYRSHEMLGFLAYHLRQALDALIAAGVPAGEVVAALRRKGSLLFRRMELDLLASHPDLAPDLVRETLLDRRFYDEYEVSAEYASLAERAFGMLEEAEREQLLGWILEGPDLAWEADEERRTRWREQHVRDWLALLRPHLDVPRVGLLERLIDRHGEPRPIAQNEPAVSFWSGPTSPVEKTDIARMSIDELLAFVRTWVPEGAWMSATHEGLARAIADDVAAGPERYADRAPDFEGLDPTYVRALLNGFDEALRAERFFEWVPVLTLAEWVIAQAVGPDEPSEGGFDRDTDFRPARKALASLLKRGLARHGDGGLPLAERRRVWELIRILASDPNPSPAYEARWGGDNMDPATLALNTVRPYAHSAAVEYAIWVNYHQNALEYSVGMASVPELKALLEATLDAGHDPSATVRAAIGQELGRLVWLDAEWVKAVREALFPEDETLLPLRLAVFDTFVLYGWKTAAVVETIPEEYTAAIRRAGTNRGTRRGEEPDRHLADHLMSLYWQGVIPLTGEPGLIREFFSTVPGELRKRAIHYVGWSLFRTEKPVPPEPLARLRELWEWRAAELEAQIAADVAADAARGEMAEFGWWFASRAFDLDWASPHLQAVLRRLGSTEWGQEVAEYLADVVDERPREVLATLGLFDPGGGGEVWSVDYWLEHAITILRRCLRDEDDAVRGAAAELINRWVAHGHLRLRELLS